METNYLDSEMGILGGLLREPFRIDDLDISPEDFYTYRHKVIFKAMLQLAEANQPIDIITVAEKLEQNKDTAITGAVGYLGDLITNSPGGANIKAYCAKVKDSALVRELFTIATEIIMDCERPYESAADIVEKAEASIFSILEKRETNEPKHIESAVKQAVEHLGNVIDGVTYQGTGLVDLDNVLGGLRGGAVYVIAARPSMGKTALACTIAHNIAREDKQVYFATLEMPAREIATRIMAIDANLDIGNIKNWQDEDYNKFAKAAGSVTKLPITIDEQEGLPMAKLRSRVRRLKRRKGLDCIVIDYMQLMKFKSETREREIANISAGLKSLAKELDIPVIVLAQLNRDCDSRADSRPLLSDLRESGSIEQDADVVIMLYRDEQKNKDSQYVGIAELIIRKNRHGATKDVMTQFTKETMHFSNIAHGWLAPVVPVISTGKGGRFGR